MEGAQSMAPDNFKYFKSEIPIFNFQISNFKSQF
jgi:hypothetical protein